MFQNAFLRDFVRMRQTLKPTPVEDKKKRESVSALTLATIVEEKPPTKEVLKYFRKKANEEDED